MFYSSSWVYSSNLKTIHLVNSHPDKTTLWTTILQGWPVVSNVGCWFGLVLVNPANVRLKIHFLNCNLHIFQTVAEYLCCNTWGKRCFWVVPALTSERKRFCSMLTWWYHPNVAAKTETHPTKKHFSLNVKASSLAFSTDITKTFSPGELPLAGYSLRCRQFSVNLRRTRIILY